MNNYDNVSRKKKLSIYYESLFTKWRAEICQPHQQFKKDNRKTISSKQLVLYSGFQMLATGTLACYIWHQRARVQVMPRSTTFNNLPMWQNKTITSAYSALNINLMKWSVYFIPNNYIIGTSIESMVTIHCNKHLLKTVPQKVQI